MRRATAVILGTLSGTALLVGAKIGNASPLGDAGSDGADTSAVTVSAPGAPPGSSPAPKHSASGRSSTPTTPRSSRKTKPTTTPTNTPSPTPPPPPSGPTDGTYTAHAGVAGGHYGTLSMTVTISGHKITAISASENGGESQCYHSACPTLTAEALRAQSANVATVSRATYTSDAYRSALAAVLTSAHG